MFYNPYVLKEQFFTLHLKEKGEYEVEDVYCRFFESTKVGNEIYGIKAFQEYFPRVLNVQHFISKLSKLNEMDNFYKLYYAKEPTTGMYMIITALAQGYREIYLTGIDFYGGGGVDYAFDVKNRKIGELIPAFNQNNVEHHRLHDGEIDAKLLEQFAN